MKVCNLLIISVLIRHGSCVTLWMTKSKAIYRPCVCFILRVLVRGLVDDEEIRHTI